MEINFCPAVLQTTALVTPPAVSCSSLLDRSHAIGLVGIALEPMFRGSRLTIAAAGAGQPVSAFGVLFFKMATPAFAYPLYEVVGNGANSFIEDLQRSVFSVKLVANCQLMNKPDPRPNRLPEKSGKPAGKVAPTKAETALLPAFAGLTEERIHVPVTQSDCEKAANEIFAAGVGGFDTEARPTFRAGQKSDGPHVVQFALTDKAFIFQLHRSECEQAVSDLIASDEVLKVGFGLKNDHGQIRNRLGIELKKALDLDQVFRKMGYRGQIGVRGAMGALLNQGFKKSKSITTSNWAKPDLRPAQLLYAANDAYAALKIMEALQDEGHLDQ